MIPHSNLNIFRDVLTVRTDTGHRNNRMYEMVTVRVLQRCFYWYENWYCLLLTLLQIEIIDLLLNLLISDLICLLFYLLSTNISGILFYLPYCNLIQINEIFTEYQYILLDQHTDCLWSNFVSTYQLSCIAHISH